MICARNAEKYISGCIESILQQSFSDFELIIVDDRSNDHTADLIKNFKDDRIKYYKNKEWSGITKSRNACLHHANGEFVFFTDSDCIVSKDWIKQGLKYLQNPNYVGVEGKTRYVSQTYQPTFADHSCESHPGDYMTGNVAYKKDIIGKVGGFDEKFDCHEDRDLGLRILKLGKIKFNPNMTVFVQKQILTPRDLIKRSNAIRNRVYLFKKGDKRCIVGRFVDPISIAMILCPPLIFTSLISYKFETADDYKLVPFKYINLVYARLQLWQESAKESVILL